MTQANGEQEELIDYEEDEIQEDQNKQDGNQRGTTAGHVGIHTSGFKDFQLKPELLRATADCGFEHPSEVQHECIPQAVIGRDINCQAKSGMGKTAVFVLSVLHQLEPKDGEVAALVICHTRELAFQICTEFQRFATYLPNVRIGNFFGGLPVKGQQDQLKEPTKCPHIIVGTPGRLKQLVKTQQLKLGGIKYFIIDECDKVLDNLDMRTDVQYLFKQTPLDKQVMMFSATMSQEIRPVCKKFMTNPLELYVDDSKLTLHGLVQHYIKLTEDEKNRKLSELLDAIDFNQVVIFVKSVPRAKELSELLNQINFPSICIHSGQNQEDRIKAYQTFRNYKKRILVATDLVGRGIDIERVNIVINYDMPETDPKLGNGADTYLHRVGRAGRFGTKGLAITFISSDKDQEVLQQVQDRFDVKIKELPDVIPKSDYMNN